MDQESLVLEVDPRSVLAAIKQANTAVEGWAKGTIGAGDRMQKSIERMAEAPAKPIKPGRNGKRGFSDYKSARGLQPFRDRFWTGRTMRSLKVKAASVNRVTIGFVDPNADRIAHVNKLREKQFACRRRIGWR